MPKRKYKKNNYQMIAIIIVIALCAFYYIGNVNKTNDSFQNNETAQVEEKVDQSPDNSNGSSGNEANNDSVVEDINNSTEDSTSDSAQSNNNNNNNNKYYYDPATTTDSSWQIDNNTPSFDYADGNMNPHTSFSDLDSRLHVQPAYGVLSKETMPTEERGDISNVKPTGWKQKKYDFIDGKYLYNRCHLIGFQLCGENDNWKNLMTGTRFMNVEGMLPYENKVAKHIKETGHKVQYQIIPVFDGDNAVASGVEIEARCVENPNELQFDVFCPNIQPGVSINYQDGSSRKAA